MQRLNVLNPHHEGDEGSRKNKVLVKRTGCVRCGSCCSSSSPMLLKDDMPLFISNLLNDTNTYTVRSGEPLYNIREQALHFAPFEIIKICEYNGCQMFVRGIEGPAECAIYEDRPVQCRDYKCWHTEPPMEGLEEVRLTRADLFGTIKPLYEVITKHEEVCSYEEMADLISSIEGGAEDMVGALLDMLRFDLTTREFLLGHFGVSGRAMDLILGRPLIDRIRLFGLEVVQEGDGFVLRPTEKPPELDND